jgi:hypothetical protein
LTPARAGGWRAALGEQLADVAAGEDEREPADRIAAIDDGGCGIG